MIRTDQLSYSIGDFRLQQVSLNITQGEYFVLLGPPGSGKTILLECLCGLKQIKAGQIYIDGRNVTDTEPRRRNIGYVPQDYALLPHLSVERNIKFGLHTKGYSPSEIVAKVGKTVEMLGIGHLLRRSTSGLSGGEKQRVALARALVLQPKVLLLDEPVCALDEVSRQVICGQLFHIQRQLGLTTIHVSHNLEEAFSVADRAAVLHQGLLQQVGPLDELLRKPNSEFVARFMRCENILSGKVISPGSQNTTTEVIVGDLKLHLPGRHDGDVKFVIRPENVLALPAQQHDNESSNEFPAKLLRWRDCGGYVRVELDGPIKLTAHLTHAGFAELKARHQPNLIVRLSPENIHVLPK
jgi:ABC-type Fe3+/spermidine/putrescine transport system ATPase subunit